MLLILMISAICVIVTDLTDFPDSLKKGIWMMVWGKKPFRNFSFHLIDCSLCQSWWLSLLCLIIMGKISVWMICWSLIVAYFTTVTKAIIVLVKDIMINLIDWIYKILDLK